MARVPTIAEPGEPELAPVEPALFEPSLAARLLCSQTYVAAGTKAQAEVDTQVTAEDADDESPSRVYSIFGGRISAPRRHSYVLAVLASMLLTIAFLLVSAIQGQVGHLRGAPFVAHLFHLSAAKSRYRLPMYEDPSGFLVMSLAAITPLVFLSQCRRTEELLRSTHDVARSPKHQNVINKRTAAMNRFLARIGSRAFTIGTFAGGFVVAVFVLRRVEELGPLRGLVSDGAKGLRSEGWWLTGGWSDPARVVIATAFAYWLVVAIKQVSVFVATLVVLDRVSRCGGIVAIDPENRDGMHGLGPARSYLAAVVTSSITLIAMPSAILILWIGSYPWSVAILGSLLTLVAAGVGSVAYAIRSSLRQRKLADVTALVLQMDPIEQVILEAARSGNDAGSAPAYLTILRERRDAVLAIPPSGFRIREVGVSVGTVLLTPALLVVVGALVG